MSYVSYPDKPKDIIVKVFKRDDGNFGYEIQFVIDDNKKLTVISVEYSTTIDFCKMLAREMISEVTTGLKLDGEATFNYH